MEERSGGREKEVREEPRAPNSSENLSSGWSGEAVETRVPKARFTAPELCRREAGLRSSSLPRLHGHYFPAEQIRRADEGRQSQRFSATGPILLQDPASDRSQNYGQGDAEAAARFSSYRCNNGQQHEPSRHNEMIPEEGRVESRFEGTTPDSGDVRQQPVGGRLGNATLPCCAGHRGDQLDFHPAIEDSLSMPQIRCHGSPGQIPHREPHCDVAYRREMQQRANNQRLIMNGRQCFYHANVQTGNASSQDHRLNRYETETRLGGPSFSVPRNNWPGSNPEECQSGVNGARENRKGTGQPSSASPGPERRTGLRFTADMIRDQERLVSAMRQQGIPEDTMKRQFDALLNEQRKYLMFLEQIQEEMPAEARAASQQQPPVPARKRNDFDEKPEWMAHVTPPRFSSAPRPLPERNQRPDVRVTDPQDRVNADRPVIRECEAKPFDRTTNEYASSGLSHHHTGCTAQQQQQHRDPQPSAYRYCPESAAQTAATYEESAAVTSATTEPCSLLRMKIYREVVRPQKRNNGLQDPETARRLMEIFKNSETAKNAAPSENGLGKSRCAVRLNGIQEPDAATRSAEIGRRAACEPRRRNSANGLENSRNPGNPRPSQRRAELLASLTESTRETVTEYPVQRQITRRGHCGREAVPRTRSCLSSDYPTSEEHRHPCPRNARESVSGGGDVRSSERSPADSQQQLDPNCNGQAAGIASCCPTMPGLSAPQPEIREARIIGGITYLARKPSYMPDPCLSASSNLQPPFIR